MKNPFWKKRIRRVDTQVSIFMAVIILFNSFSIALIYYKMTYCDMIKSLADRAYSIYEYVETSLDKDTFLEIQTKDDQNKKSYQSIKMFLEAVKNTTGVRYLYTAKENKNGDFIYVIDGLSLQAEDFRYPGDFIEPEIQGDMKRALTGEIILPKEIKKTDWGKVFVTYFPIYNGDTVIGVLGIEFEAEHQYNVYYKLSIMTPFIVVFFCLISIILAVMFFRRISNPSYRDMANTDQLTQLKNRNAYDVDVKNLQALCEKEQLVFVVMDLNHLKQINDSKGHEYGDIYIQIAAEALQISSQKTDTLYRIGGDEFVIISRNSSAQKAEKLIKEIEQNFENLKQDWMKHTSLAIGYAVYDKQADKEIRDTIRRADAMMYQCKRKHHQKKEKESSS